MRNVAVYQTLVMSRLMSPAPKIGKWRAHRIVYNYILSVASKVAIAYTILPQMGFYTFSGHSYPDKCNSYWAVGMTCRGRCHEKTCAAWQTCKSVLWILLDSGVDCTDEFYDVIFQDRDYVDLKQMMKLLKVKNITSSWNIRRIIRPFKMNSIIEAKENADVVTCDIPNAIIKQKPRMKTGKDIKQSWRLKALWLKPYVNWIPTIKSLRLF